MDRDGESTPRVVRSFVEAVPTPTVACDPESHAIRAANAPAAALLGRDRGTLTLMGLTDLGETDETIDGEPIGTLVDEAVDRDGVTEFEWETGGERGRRRLSLSLHATTIADERWLIVGLTDVTDRVTAEEELRSQLRVVDALASTVPTALFQCTADGTLARWNDRLAAAERDGEGLSGTDLTALFDDETRDTADRLLRVGETSRRVERLLADRPAPKPIDLADAVDEALASLPPELREGADIEVDVPEGITVSAIGYLAEATAELVENAVRHSDAERPRVEVTAAELPSESWASLVVADDGWGIPPAGRAVLTGEETPLEHASGLGLWYVNWIVSAGGGSFDIGAASTGGTRIEMELRTPDGE